MLTLTIGKLAALANVGAGTIRYYERSGVMPEPDRTPAGYRLYNNRDVRQLRFVKEAQSFGFTLEEIKELLSLTEKPGSDCAKVNKIARIKLEQIEDKIALLEKIRITLKRLADYCPDDDQPLSECSIINHLYGD